MWTYVIISLRRLIGTFGLIVLETAVLHRGCYFDMEDDWRTNCETTHKDRCTRCYGTNCNTNEQGSGHIATASKVLIIVMLSVGVLWWPGGNNE